MPLADLSDHARLQLVPCDPPLTLGEGAALAAQLDKLFIQFAREDRIHAWAIAVEVDGALLVIAWEGDSELSGCSRDKVARLLLSHEERSGRRLLSAPPILIRTAAGPRCVDRPGLRQLIASGVVDGQAAVYDLRAPTLGAWRTAAHVPLVSSAYAAYAR